MIQVTGAFAPTLDCSLESVHWASFDEGISRMDMVPEMFYPYLEGVSGGYQGGNKDFHMEVQSSVPEKRLRFVSTPAHNLAVIWDFGETFAGRWLIRFVEQEVAFLVAFADLESFWIVCDRAAEATLALNGRRDRGLDSRLCAQKENDQVEKGPTQEDIDFFLNFVRTFSTVPVVHPFTFSTKRYGSSR